MKPLLLIFFTAFLFSCTEYQYMAVSSSQLAKNSNNEFVVENDTLKITYRFNGYHGPVKIIIYNKSNEPLEINWKKSALIMNEQALSYYSPNLFLNGTIQQDSLRNLFYGNSFYTSDIQANIYVNEPSQFIPPQSSISKVPLSLPMTEGIPLPDSIKKETYMGSDNSFTKFKRIKYSREQSPISFRSYLVFNYGGDRFREFSLNHSFFVSEIWQSASSPFDFPAEITDKGNVFNLSFSE